MVLFSLVADSANCKSLLGDVLVLLGVIHDLNRDVDACNSLPKIVDVEEGVHFLSFEAHCDELC